VAWDVAEVESADIAADLVQRACLRERYRRPRGFGKHQQREQPLPITAMPCAPSRSKHGWRSWVYCAHSRGPG
jgi:hypothetical protein